MRNTTASRKRICQVEKLEERQLLFFAGGMFSPVDQGFVIRANEPEMVRLETWHHPIRALDLALPAASTEEHYELVLVEQPSHGKAAISADGKSILYQPNPNYIGQDSLSYRVSNDKPTDQRAATHNISIAVIEQPWLAVPDWTKAAPGQTVQLDVIQNDVPNARFVGVDSWKLTVTEAISSQGGKIAIANDGRSIKYEAPADFVGVDDISYTAKDQDGFSVKGTAKIRIVSTGNTNGSNTETVWPEQLNQLLIELAVKRNYLNFGTYSGHYPFYYGSGDLLSMNRSFATTGNDSSNGSEFSNAISHLTGTNNQIAAIDEADWAKTDGEYLYILSSNDSWGGFHAWSMGVFPAEIQAAVQSTLTVFDVRTPSAPKFITQLDLGSDRVLAQDLFEDRLTIFLARGNQTVMQVFDTSNPAELKRVSTAEYSGNFSQSRRVGDRLILMTQSYLSVPNVEYIEPVVPEPEVIDTEAILRGNWVRYSLRMTETGSQYLSRVSELLDETVLPSYVVKDALGNETALGKSTEFNQSHLDFLAESNNLLNIITLDSNSSGQPIDWDWARGHTQVLVTPESIYLAGASPDDFGSTLIDKFDLNSSGVQYTASGSVAGSLLNSFSMDEYQGNLRIATSTFAQRFWLPWDWNVATDSPADPILPGNNLFVLSETDNGSLSVIGSVTGLAPDEQIYAARFVEERAFLVTFQQVDPLFVIDLSDPTKPTVDGELKIPGYSQYLEMIDPNHLVSVGRDADPETGLFGGLVVSLFDVSDSKSPKLKSRFSIEGGREIQTPIAWVNSGVADHHAVNYFDSHQTLTVPIYSHSIGNGQSLQPNDSYHMLTFVVDVDKGISQSNAIQFESMASRAIRVGDYLYSMSQQEVKVTSLVAPGLPVFEYEILTPAEPIAEHPNNSDPDNSNPSEPNPNEPSPNPIISIIAPHTIVEVTAGQPIIVELPDMTKTLGAFQQSLELKIMQAHWSSGDGQVEVIEEGTKIKITPDRHARGSQWVKYIIGDGNNRHEATVEVLAEAWQWHNESNSLDANADGLISPTDALLTINALNELGGVGTDHLDQLYADGTLNNLYHLDSNNDGRVSPSDALLIINHLNERAEGESAGRITQAAAEIVAAGQFYLPDSEEIHRRKS